MASMNENSTSRRLFLKFLAASPLLAYAGVAAQAADRPSILEALEGAADLITSPGEAINVFDFEPVARKNISPAHFGYLASGIDSEVTLRANREAFSRYYLRPRRLYDVSRVDTSIELFGVKYATPIILAPTGGNKAFHPEGEVAVAKGARKGGHLLILATPATTSVEEATAARGAPIWFQLYATPSWPIAHTLVKRAESAGCPVVVVTVDRLAGRNQETFERLRRRDPRDCTTCHSPGIQGQLRRRPMFDGIDLSGLTSFQSANMTWDFIQRLRAATTMKIVIKGILTEEDAARCVESGADGVIVSSHGGRGEDSGRATLDCLPEVVSAVGGRLPVLVDSGFRRGTDIVMALAMGAQGVCIGRPYLWGLGAFGQAGVEQVLQILRTELEVAMKQCGVRSRQELTPAFVRRAL